jgi:hypothetical protein
MRRQKLTWYWLGPCLVAIGHGERWFYAKTYGHGPTAYAQFQFIDERVMPWYWATNALAAIVLLVFGRKREAIPAWILAIALFLVGWFLVYPTFLA